MKTLKFYIDGKEVNPPLEYRGIEVEVNFEDINEIQTSITQEKFSFVNDEANLLNEYVENGTLGGLGVYWGLPFKIELDNLILFDGYIDLTNDAEFSCEKVIAKVREKKKLDWIDEIADGFSFDLLYSKGIITSNDFVKVPYILSEIPDYRQAALFFLYAFVIEREIEKLVKDISDIAADLAGVFTTIAGVLKLIFLVAYLAALIISIIKLIKQMIEELISPVRYHMGMLTKTHFEKACQYLGLTFQSSLFQNIASTTYDKNNAIVPAAYWENECIIPEKNKEGFKRNKTTLQMGYWNGTFGDFLRAQLNKFNARFVIINGVFRFERRDHGSSTAVWKIPDVRRDFHGINADELVSNYLIQFQVDNLDLNTINRYRGTNAKNYITSKVKDATRAELIKGLKQPPIPFALGRRKNELTRVESLLKDLLAFVDILLKPMYAAAEAIIKGVAAVVKAINKLIGVLNAVGAGIKKIPVPSANFTKTSLAQTIGNRVGMLALSSDFIGVPKVVMIEGSGWDVKITSDNETKLSAENLWNKYHFIESMVPSTARPAGNQAYRFSMSKIPFCIHDYNEVRGLGGNNQGEAKIVSPEGNPARLISLKWNIWDDKAELRYKEEKLFTTNIEETLLINEGE